MLTIVIVDEYNHSFLRLDAESRDGDVERFFLDEDFDAFAFAGEEASQELMIAWFGNKGASYSGNLEVEVDAAGDVTLNVLDADPADIEAAAVDVVNAADADGIIAALEELAELADGFLDDADEIVAGNAVGYVAQIDGSAADAGDVDTAVDNVNGYVTAVNSAANEGDLATALGNVAGLEDYEAANDAAYWAAYDAAGYDNGEEFASIAEIQEFVNEVNEVTVFAANSGATSSDNGDGTATITVTVQNSNGDALTGLEEADFAIYETNTTTDWATPFDSFTDNGDGTYTIVVDEADGNPSETVDVEVDGVNVETGLPVEISGN